MDLSKLPKLSETSKHAPATDAPSVQPATQSAAEPLGSVLRPVPVQPTAYRRDTIGIAETWLSIGVGVFVLLYWPRFLQWASSRMFHTHFNEFTDTNTGAVVPYQHVPEFWSDLGPALLGIVLIVDGLLIFSRKPWLVLFALVLTAISTAYNLFYVIWSFPQYGLAPLSFLAVIFGGFILMTQWSAFRSLHSRI
jgi:hypothetical protein